MIENLNPHAVRMRDAIAECVGKEAASDFVERYPLPKAANAAAKMDWARKVCGHLAENYDDALVRRIREGCCCNSGNSAAKVMRTCLKNAASIREFVERFNSTNPPGSLEYISENSVLLCYPKCFCSCVKQRPEALPEVWCYCSLAYARNVFRQLFGRSVHARLVESVKTGGSRCAIAVEWE